jgi:hypothetical protein
MRQQLLSNHVGSSRFLDFPAGSYGSLLASRLMASTAVVKYIAFNVALEGGTESISTAAKLNL